ncbi:MAG: hypothetical protein J3K34DRAFT_120466 [Monoraphidium minutum]|nr:MAG: hypothetical protein J3K34DRAFT_120466 [Monoraphidium minutum]
MNRCRRRRQPRVHEGPIHSAPSCERARPGHHFCRTSLHPGHAATIAACTPAHCSSLVPTTITAPPSVSPAALHTYPRAAAGVALRTLQPADIAARPRPSLACNAPVPDCSGPLTAACFLACLGATPLVSLHASTRFAPARPSGRRALPLGSPLLRPPNSKPPPPRFQPPAAAQAPRGPHSGPSDTGRGPMAGAPRLGVGLRQWR